MFLLWNYFPCDCPVKWIKSLFISHCLDSGSRDFFSSINFQYGLRPFILLLNCRWFRFCSLFIRKESEIPSALSIGYCFGGLSMRLEFRLLLLWWPAWLVCAIHLLKCPWYIHQSRKDALQKDRITNKYK